MNPKISVIVPVYNKRSSADACIRSILAQDYCDFELIIIDDGSTDGSEALCDSYALEKPELIRVIHKTNGGVSSARNIGLETASGSYICFVDADDTIAPRFLSALVCATDGHDIVTCSNSHDIEWHGSSIADYVDTDGRTMLGTAVWGKLYKRDIIEKYGIRFDESVSFGEDTLFNLELWSHVDRIRSIPVNLYNYNVDISRRYELSAAEIHKKIEALRQAYRKIDAAFGSNLSISRDINITISLYPLTRIFSNYEEYRDLYRHYYPQASDEDFINDERCSPVLRLISESKIILKRTGFKSLTRQYRMAGQKFSQYIPNIRCRFRIHRAVLFMLSQGLLSQAALLVYLVNKLK